MNKETLGIDYEKEYLRLSIENSTLKRENEKYKKTILAMSSVYPTMDNLAETIKDIEFELKRIGRCKR